MKTYRVWFDGAEPESGVTVKHLWADSAVNEASDQLYNDSAGEGFDPRAITPTVLHARDEESGELTRWEVLVEFLPSFDVVQA